MSPKLTDLWLLAPSVLHEGPANFFCTSLIFAKLNMTLAELALQLTAVTYQADKSDSCWRDSLWRAGLS